MNRMIEPVAKIYTEFSDKFGIPRQSRLADTVGMIVFEPSYRHEDSIRGLEEYSHIWLIWGFQDVLNSNNWTATVRPPRLGGNVRKGVFATRSPYRPNGLGLSLVKIQKISYEEGKGHVIYVEGVDMLNETPVFDIKPYVPYVESIPEAKGGFTDKTKDYKLSVTFSEEVISVLCKEKRNTLIQILEQDPRPAFHNDGRRIYGMKYCGYEIKFRVENKVLNIESIEPDDI